ncbi:uncharacterized protein FOMMEDRAFT_171011 [Fomitiporia mediterranea MF3/22]|uniref:uncharacterized protein n=1 Tax=Fomitiporia mediterranea (strain MF3/22) TaxID=694068 RepID=UPI0004408F35|nr:uncharacterized protein FOMMEDRAFT_171011 [Fomitiporia mediterranea MF3/22]EJC98829.1 hypothetical protein FOMMEDRAFT_171011 [Fomitiporia mediterranea MF3/22]
MRLSFDFSHSAWSRFFTHPGSKLLSLPEEILVDEIFSWLSVRDIVRLRQVCKALAVLTKKPVIWKRFLPYISQLQQPLAPLPPTYMYGLEQLTGHEMESVVSRAITYDKTWKQHKIEYQDTCEVFAHQHVEEVVLLPGGHYLVMSVKSFDGQYGLAIWSLGHRATQRPAPVLFRRTEVRAYGLTAKYMNLGPFHGIVVAFLRKRHKYDNDSRYIPETFELGGKEDQEDPFMPLKYECTALFVPVMLLDIFNDRKARPMTDEYAERVKLVASKIVATHAIPEGLALDIWTDVGRVRTGAQLGVVSLDVIQDVPVMCVVKRPNKIVIQPLGNLVDNRSVLECLPIPQYGETHHSIWNFRVLPDQSRILVVRNITKNDAVEMESDHLVFETYGIPDFGETLQLDAWGRNTLTLGRYLNVQISEVQRTVPPDYDDSITPNLTRGRYPQPLSIYLRTAKGMAHHSLWPVEKTAQQMFLYPTPEQERSRHFIYSFERTRHYFIGDAIDDTFGEEMDYESEDTEDRNGTRKSPPRRRKDDALRILPGARRAFVYAIPRNYRSTEPPVTACWGFQYNRKDYTKFLDEPPMTNAEFVDTWPELETPESSQEMPIPEDTDNPYHPSLDIPPAAMERETMLGPMKLPLDLQAKLPLGLSAVCFDEDTGRTVFATKADNHLHIVDFAHSRPQDADDAMHNKEMDERLKNVKTPWDCFASSKNTRN